MGHKCSMLANEYPKRFSIFFLIFIFHFKLQLLQIVTNKSQKLFFSYKYFNTQAFRGLTDENSYRPIALSNIASKVFEHLILLKLREYI